MATLVKEKRREKKKSKAKHVPKSEAELPMLANDLSLEVTQSTEHITNVADNISSIPENVGVERIHERNESETWGDSVNSKNIPDAKTEVEGNQENVVVTNIQEISTDIQNVASNPEIEETHEDSAIAMNMEQSSNDTQNVIASEPDMEGTQVGSDINMNIEQPSVDIQSMVAPQPEIEGIQDQNNQYVNLEAIEQNIMPSAPEMVEVPALPVSHIVEPKIFEPKPKIACMPLEEAVRVYGGKEIAEVKAMSEREEALVEAGPVSGSEHPLVDLLSTFRLSLTAVERERAQISCNIAEEERARSQLWKIEKRSLSVSEKCKCGTDISFKAVFDHAELQKEKLPVARMRLEALTRDVQESYCHHQHAALLTHCQIEDLISETIASSKLAIREALFLILQALRLCDSAAAYAQALQRWASALSAALVDNRDLRQLLFLLHHLFRQTRSVRWAASVVCLSATDSYSVARAIAVLDLLLARPGLETAVECTEELEAWEEVDVRGGAGAVGEGQLRERDLLALLNAFPLQAMFSRLTLFPRFESWADNPLAWCDASGGHGVLKSCCGVRTLLNVFHRAILVHPTYTRLHGRLRELASKLLHSLAALYMFSSPSYAPDLSPKIQAEMEACFAAGFQLMGDTLEKLPTSLLTEDAARQYCTSFILGLHDKIPRVEALGIEAPALPCEECVRIVTQAAIDRTTDQDLARTVLEFLVQTGLKRKSPGSCKGKCEATAREQLRPLLATHRALHTAAFSTLADIAQTESIDPSLMKYLCPEEWRPIPYEIRLVVDDWVQRCPQLIQHLLLNLTYTPHVGISLESQLTLGTWLCWWQREAANTEWCWAALCKLRVHRSQWNLPLDAPPPEGTGDLFSTAYALLSSAWGHCIPLACSPGAEALCKLAVARPVEALHCVGPLMRLMALSPESVSYTPQFTEIFAELLNAGPSLVQRAFGRGGLSGVERLQQLVLAQLAENRYSEQAPSILSAWLHALWKLSLPVSSRAILDAAVRASLQWATLDAYVTGLIQEENSKEYIADAIRNVSTAPLLCEAVLRNVHSIEVRSYLHQRLLDALWQQKRASQRIHVDNALKEINPSMTSEELVIHRTAAAVLTAPYTHPAHLTLWRLFFHIYLQRPPSSPQDFTAPVGPLLFSGLIKSRVVSQLKKRLQDTATYHQKQAELLKFTLKNVPPPTRPARRSKASPTGDSSIFPTLSISDLTGEKNDVIDEDDDEEAGDVDVGTQEDASQDNTPDMISYHTVAEKLIRVYAQCLEAGENTRSVPQNTDLAKFIPEQVLDAAWRSSFPTLPPDTPTTPRAHTQSFDQLALSTSHYDRAAQIITSIKDNSRDRPRITSIGDPLCNTNLNDSRSLMAVVDKLLAEIQKLSQDWSSEVRYIAKLDAQLWDLVGALRVRRPLPPVAKTCAQGCKPTTVRIPHEEWCLSTGAEQGIHENRRSACAALRRLARARPDAAKTAATLHCIARRVRNAEGALRVVERAGRCAQSAENCVIAKQALNTFVTNIAERWLCHDGTQCASLVRSWSSSAPAQQALIGALLSPRRLPPADWPKVYTTLLTSDLPPLTAFSYLSKFEMNRWAENADTSQRQAVLEALVAAAKKMGLEPEAQYQVLLELLGVHASAVMTSLELCTHVCVCARACATHTLPPAFYAAVVSAVNTHAYHVPFDKLGHLLRELGTIWWEVRTTNKSAGTYAMYADHTAALLRSLQRAFVAAAIAISYEPTTVAWYAWSSIRESWGPWITPHNSPPLLPSTGEEESYTTMLSKFVETINQVMEQCPGSEEAFLRQVWEWAVGTFLGVHHPRMSQESRVQLSALLVQLSSLQWNHQWFHVDCLKLALQAVSTGDKEMNAWLGRRWRDIGAASWLRGVTAESLAPALAALLALFLSPHAQHAKNTLLEACNLPWHRLPEAALDEALDRFFMDHYNTAIPYHQAPQLMIVVSASELRKPAGAACVTRQSRGKRAHAVSQWVRAAAAPALHAHVPEHSATLLAIISELAPYIECSEGELEELLNRGMAILCMEAAAAALPVWEQWVSSSKPRLRLACAAAVASLTALDSFAALADAVAKAHLADKESSGWYELRNLWMNCPWADCSAMVARGKLHAGYAVLLARPHSLQQLRTTFNTLLSLDVKFTENEEIIASWICAACRVAIDTSCKADDDSKECLESAVGLLTRWGQEQRRNLLQVVSLQAAPDSPTPQLRLMCKLAQCIITPSSEPLCREYEAGARPLLGHAAGAALAWARRPRHEHLRTLAMRLYPKSDRYFAEEFRLAPDRYEPRDYPPP